jgi:hypothetical protein
MAGTLVKIRIHEQARPVQYRQPGLLGIVRRHPQIAAGTTEG